MRNREGTEHGVGSALRVALVHGVGSALCVGLVVADAQLLDLDLLELERAELRLHLRGPLGHGGPGCKLTLPHRSPPPSAERSHRPSAQALACGSAHTSTRLGELIREICRFANRHSFC